MKNIFNRIKKSFILLSIGIIPFVFYSCGSNEKELAQQYIDACAENDFAMANAVLDKMEIDSDHGEKYEMCGHREYVNKKEALYLLSQNDEQSSDRLIFLITENGSYRYDLDGMTKLAISQRNVYLVDKLIDLNHGADASIAKAAVSADMQDVVFKMVGKNKGLLSEQIIADYCKSKDAPKFNDICTSYVNDCIQELVDNQGTLTRPQIGLAKGYDSPGSEYEKYNTSIDEHNTKCVNTAKIIAQTGLSVSSSRLTSLIKPKLSWQLLGDWYTVTDPKSKILSGGEHAYKVKEDCSEVKHYKSLIVDALNGK